MRFLVDENADVVVARWLRSQEHEVFSVYLHRGIVLLRLENERSANKIYILRQLTDEYADQLADSFIVVTETQVRFAKARS